MLGLKLSRKTYRNQNIMHGVQRRMISVVNFFVFLRLLFFCFVVDICDLVDDVETIFHLSYVRMASGNLF